MLQKTRIPGGKHGDVGEARADQLANATASTALNGPTTTLVRGDVWVWATVSSKEKDASCGLTMKLGTSIVCHPSANWTSETKSWSMDAIHSMLIVRPTVGPNCRPDSAGNQTNESGRDLDEIWIDPGEAKHPFG